LLAEGAVRTRIAVALAATFAGGLSLSLAQCSGGSGASGAQPQGDGSTAPDAGVVAREGGDAPAAGGDGGPSSSDAGAADAREEIVGVVDAGACPSLPGAGQWQNVTPPASDAGTSAIAVRPDYPSTVYAGVQGKGIFRSVDCGASWSLVSTGTHASDMSSGNPWSIAIDPVAPDTMYVVEGYGSSGLWKSTNGGVDWQNVLTDPTVTAAFYANGFITGVDIDPTDHTHLVVESHGNCSTGATCAAESTNGGSSWTLVDMKAAGAWSENSSIAILDRTTWIYCGLFSGMFRTADEGATWQPVDAGGALPSCNYYDPRVWLDSTGRTYVPAIAYTGAGLLQSQPNGNATWTLVPGSPQATVLMPTEKNLILSGRGSPFWIASQSDPTTWTTLATPASWASGSSGVFLAYDGAHHVLYSSNWGGGLWQLVQE
jgi:hypothetical protein